MKRLIGYADRGCCPCGGDGQRQCAGQGQGRPHRHAVRTAGRARPAAAQRLPARGQDARRQARRPRGRGARAGRRAQARRRGDQGQGLGRARQGRLRRRPDLLQHPAGDPEAGDRGRRHPDQPECRHLELRRQGMQPEPLRHLLPERSGARGARANTRRTTGIKKVFIMAPNYQAGKDALAGFKHYFKGEVVDEVYVPLDQLDYSAELSKIAAAKPDAIFVFLPGGMGVNFVKQFRQAGLADKITFLSAFTVDEVDAAGAAGRRARLLRRRQLGARSRQPAEQGVRRRLREGIQRGAGDLRVPGLRRGAADRQRAQARPRATPPTRTRCAPR